MTKPSDELTGEQKDAATTLESIADKLKRLDETKVANTTADSMLAGKLKAIQNVRESLRLLDRTYKQFLTDTAKDLATLGLKAEDLATIKITLQPIDAVAAGIPQEQVALKESNIAISADSERLITQQTALKTKLNAPQLLYQQSLKAIEEWNTKLAELTGAADAPDTKQGLEARIAQLDGLPALLDAHRTRRDALAGEIFDILYAQRKAREELFKPVQELIQSNSLIRDEYKLQFRATLGGAIDAVAATLFTLIKQNSGEFRGEDDSFNTVRKLAEPLDFNKRSDALSFVSQLHDKIVIAATGSGNKPSIGISSVLRKDKLASDVYDLLFGLSFLEPRYSLLFQDTQIEQLSPGQRGALLLIFYLLVDKGRNPIILDQPEENLDNETVVSLLVPVLTEAKRRRQIIMVTHNPNLAVVCDAEQVIWSSFDRRNGSKISYIAGSIENSEINRHVVDVLEGTKPAFNNRRIKYH